MNSSIVKAATASASALAIAVSAAGQAVEWKVANGGNGHWYALDGTNRTWNGARAFASSRGGHLASFSTAQEQNAAFDLVGFGRNASIWIGLYQLPGSAEPGGGWKWVTDEPVTFNGWTPGAANPDNGIGDENFGEWTPSWGGGWNDLAESGQRFSVIEWSADCNNDGIVDYGQVRAGQLPDFNTNNIPDCCEQGIPCTVGSYPVQWRASEGGNDHWYTVVPQALSWSQARDAAQAIGGYLTTLTSAPENAFVGRLAPLVGSNAFGAWAGAYQTDRTCGPACSWVWVTGESWSYTNWWNGEPNDTAKAESFLEIFLYQTSNYWNDAPDSASYLRRYSVEWSADCNNDGVVDYGQILSGQLADANANGIPDTCEGVVSVPGDYPTIQAAIDSTPAGASRTINVAAGVYSGPIDFKGKNVVVRGAGAGATIISGTSGLTTSVVRMSGEPASAALESVTVRGGTTGSQLPNFPSALVGGGIFANSSAVSIRNCIIENNAAGFGGGIYMLACSGEISGCTIRNNMASTDGGGFQEFQSTVRLSNVAVQNNSANSRGGGMHLVQGMPVLTNVSVTGNQSANTMGGISWYSVGSSGAMLELAACTVTGNNASTGQGGIGATDGGLVTMRFAGTNVCSNLPRPNVVGQWQDMGGNTICDCIGDITVDGRVDGADLGSMLSAWGTCTATCAADLNRDGKVDGFDLGLMLANWGPCGG